MLHTPHRGRRAIAGLTALAALAFAAPAAAAPFPTACKNTVNGNNSQIEVTRLDGVAPASVAAGAALTVTGINGVVKVPGSVLQSGYNLGLIKNGDKVTGTIKLVVEGTNTAQDRQTTPEIPYELTVVITDPDGVPQSGDETASDVEVPFAAPDMNWTAGPTSETIEFRVPEVTPISPTNGGMLLTATLPPPSPGGSGLTVRFGCNPGTVTGSNPGTASYVAASASFARSTVTGGTAPTPPGGGVSNAFSFGKVKLNTKKGTASLPVVVPGAGKLSLKRGKVVGRTANPSAAGTVRLAIKARGKAAKTLKRKGKVKVKVSVSYTPNGGTKLTKSKTITLKRK